jgi:hypothetical protein
MFHALAVLVATVGAYLQCCVSAYWGSRRFTVRPITHLPAVSHPATTTVSTITVADCQIPVHAHLGKVYTCTCPVYVLCRRWTTT